MTNSVEWREWSLEGLDVTQLCFDYSLHIMMWSQERALSLVFETEIEFRTANGNVQILNPEESQSLSPLLSLLHKPVTMLRASSAGHCELRFADGSSISCAPDDQYEAWQSHGAGDLKSAALLCSPGGGSPW